MTTAIIKASEQADRGVAMVRKDAPAPENFDEILEKFIMGGDIQGLTPQQRVALYYRFCARLDIDPESGSVQYLKLQGRLTFYVTARAVDQIADKRGISRKPVDARFLRDDIFMVIAEAKDRRGRTEQRTSYISLRDREGAMLNGDALFNAFKKCETAACRRAGVALTGLGAMSEDDADSIPGAVKVSVAEAHQGAQSAPTAPPPPPPHDPPKPPPLREAALARNLYEVLSAHLLRKQGLVLEPLSADATVDDYSPVLTDLLEGIAAAADGETPAPLTHDTEEAIGGARTTYQRRGCALTCPLAFGEAGAQALLAVLRAGLVPPVAEAVPA